MTTCAKDGCSESPDVLARYPASGVDRAYCADHWAVLRGVVGLRVRQVAEVDDG